jgi:hypothetical protein
LFHPGSGRNSLIKKRQPHPWEVDTVEPITTAIVAAVTAGITDIGQKAFGVTCQGLKDPIKSKFGQDNKVSKAIAELEENPESKERQTILAESIVQEKADRDPELIHLAQQSVRALEETEQGRQAVAKYQIDARGAQIGVTGDKAHIKGWVHFHKTTAGTAFGVLGVVNGVGDLVPSPAGTLWRGGLSTIKR